MSSLNSCIAMRPRPFLPAPLLLLPSVPTEALRAASASGLVPPRKGPQDNGRQAHGVLPGGWRVGQERRRLGERSGHVGRRSGERQGCARFFYCWAGWWLFCCWWWWWWWCWRLALRRGYCCCSCFPQKRELDARRASLPVVSWVGIARTTLLWCVGARRMPRLMFVEPFGCTSRQKNTGHV